MKKRLFYMIFLSVLCFETILSASDWKAQGELYEAITKDDAKKVGEILDKHPSFVNKPIKYHNYPVLDAAFLCSIKTLKLLVDRGANLKQTDSKTGNSVLHMLAIRFHAKAREEMLDYLINEKKLKVDLLNKEKQTPFHHVFSSYIWVPSAKKGIAAIELFEKYGANLKVQDASGKTVLCFLSTAFVHIPTEQKKHQNRLKDLVEISKVLIEKGVDVNLPDNNKSTPLVSFLSYSKKLPDEVKVDFVTLLMENGAKTNIKNKKGEKALKLVDKKSELYKIMKKRYKKKK